MKGLHAYKELFIITVLCLWVPNYCDINQHDAYSTQEIQAQQILSSSSHSPEDVSPSQEKETGKCACCCDGCSCSSDVENNSPKDVQANVVYVNNVESENKEENKKEEEKSSEPLEKIPPPQESKEEKIVSSGNSKVDSINLREETETKKNVGNQKKPKTNFIVMPNGDVMQPTPPMPPPVANVKPVSEQILHTAPVRFDPVKTPALESPTPHYDGMPSFDEWKRMMLAQQQKEGQQVASPSPAGKKLSGRKRNYSSYECGAKIVASNQESEGSSRILNELVDEYMLNPCTAKIWFVIELCETVQATQIELANFELFSSCPKSFSVWSSDHFPSRDWLLLGSFTAAEQRVLQGFPLKQEGFGKFIKIELDGHYGKEHYCPLSVVRIFGTSMVDEYEEMETFASHPVVPDDDHDRLDLPSEDKKATNIFGSATDAVLNIVKKAAQALGQHQSHEGGKNNESVPEQNNSNVKQCITNNSEKCIDIPNGKLSTTSNFDITPSWKHQSLFKLLRNCDHCINPRLRYYSSALPHCRFFQAAFGPVAFKALCDWLREHPFTFAHESHSSNKKNEVPSESESPIKSQPPHVIQVPVENDTIYQNNSQLVAEVNESITVTENVFDPKSSEPTIDQIKLEPSMIQPSTTAIDLGMYNATQADFQTEATTPSTTQIENISSDHAIQTNDIGENSTSADASEGDVSAISASSTDTTSDVISETEEEQMKDFLSDSGSLSTEDMMVSEMVSPTESTLKSSEVRIEGKPEAVAGAPSAGQKESVFMRMSNRIKSLELNMSLSSQYLQELSQRYRRQMDDMQKAFNRTIGTLNDTARKAAEKDVRQQEVLNSLQLQMANLTRTVEFLVNERSSVLREMIETHICLMVVEAIIMITILSLCVRRLAGTQHAPEHIIQEEVVRLTKRRSSVDSTLGSAAPAKKIQRRSASEETLNKEEKLLIIEPTPVLLDSMLKSKKKTRKRNRAIQRSMSNPAAFRKTSPSSHIAAHKASKSDGCITKTNNKSQPLYSCENCNTTNLVFREKDKRLNGGPLHNLTNGSVLHIQEPPKKGSSRKERFSFKRFLRFQKRDSI